jgi:hypothetical protein
MLVSLATLAQHLGDNSDVVLWYPGLKLTNRFTINFIIASGLETQALPSRRIVSIKRKDTILSAGYLNTSGVSPSCTLTQIGFQFAMSLHKLARSTQCPSCGKWEVLTQKFISTVGSQFL